VLESTDYLMNNLHIFENLQSQGYPVEVDLKFKPVDKTTFDMKLSHKIRSKAHEVKEEFMSNEKLKDESMRNNFLMDRIDNEHSQSKNFVEWLLVITLSNTRKEELLRLCEIYIMVNKLDKAQEIKEHFIL